MAARSAQLCSWHITLLCAIMFALACVASSDEVQTCKQPTPPPAEKIYAIVSNFWTSRLVYVFAGEGISPPNVQLMYSPLLLILASGQSWALRISCSPSKDKA